MLGHPHAAEVRRDTGQHRTGILNYYKCPITTAALEGTNNKIKTMQRQAYGFRDQRVLQTEDLRASRNSLHLAHEKLLDIGSPPN